MVSSGFQKSDQQKDCVIPYVQSGDGGKELRRSLATLKNIGDWSGKVWIIGEYESWFEDLAGLMYIACPPNGNKWTGIQSALLKACNTPEVSEQYYYSNDDIYCHDEFFTIPPLFRESIDEQTEHSDDSYSQSLIATKRLLMRQLSLDSKDIKNYETHTPLPVIKSRLREVLGTISAIQESGYMTLQLRTYYGNVENIGGEYYADGKGKQGLAITSS